MIARFDNVNSRRVRYSGVWWCLIHLLILQQTSFRVVVESFVQLPRATTASSRRETTIARTTIGRSPILLCLAAQSSDSSTEENTENNDDDDNKIDDDAYYDWEQEETLMAISLVPKQQQSLDDECFHYVSAYAQSFPFAAVLPVQPLQYLPTEDKGVELKFLRKKTEEKSSLDGGIRFFVTVVNGETIEITAKRNSRGQSIPKVFAEKLVIQAFVKGVTEGGNGDAAAAIKTNLESPTKDFVTVSSLFHKWMDVSQQT